MLYWLFVDSKLSFGYLDGADYMQKVLDARPFKLLMEQVIIRPSAFATQLYFHAPIFLEVCMGKRLMSTVL